MKRVIAALAAILVSISVNAQSIDWGVRAGADFGTHSGGVASLVDNLRSGVTTGFYVGGVANLPIAKRWELQTELSFAMSGSRYVVRDGLYDDMLEWGVDPTDMIDDLELDNRAKLIYNTYNFQIPIMAKYSLGKGFSVMAGPYLNVRIGGDVRFNDAGDSVADYVISDFETAAYIRYFAAMLPDDYVDLDDTSTFKDGMLEFAGDVMDKVSKRFDLGVTLGFEYKTKSGIFFEGRYNAGLLNAYSNKSNSNLFNNLDIFDSALGTTTTFDHDLKSHIHSVQIGMGYRF